jgi:hypothetical protein
MNIWFVVLAFFVYFIILFVFLSQKGPDTTVFNAPIQWPVDISSTPIRSVQEGDYFKIDFEPYPGATAYEVEVLNDGNRVSLYEDDNFAKKILLPSNVTVFKTSPITQFLAQSGINGVKVNAITASGKATIELHLTILDYNYI